MSAMFHNGGLTYLQKDSSAGVYRVGAIDQHRTSLFLSNLAGSQYAFLGVRSSGGIVVQRPGGPLVEVDAGGGPTREWPLVDNRRTLALEGDSLVQFAGGSQAHVTRLGYPGASSTTAFPGWANSTEIQVLPLGNQSIAVVGIEQGRVAIVSLRGTAPNEFDLPGAEFKVAREMAKAKVREAAGQGAPVRLSVLAAMGREPDGQLILMPAPYKVESAPIVRTDDKGDLIDEFRVQLPPRSEPGFGIPMQIGRLGSNLCVLFFHGGVSCYAVAPISRNNTKRLKVIPGGVQ